MGGFSTEFKVGVFTLLAVAAMSYFMLKTRDAPFGPGEAYTVYTTIPSAEGIQFGSIVHLAGVRVGRVGKIELTPQGKARIALELNKEVQLSIDSKATLKTMGMLGDRSVHLQPGSAAEIVPPGSTLEYEPATGDLDLLTRQVSEVAVDLKAITSDLRVVSDKLKTSMVDEGLEDSVRQIVENAERFTATLERIGLATEHDYRGIVDNIKDVSGSLKEMTTSSKSLIEGSGDQISQQMESLKAATTQLNEVLANVSRIVGKVDRGEGSIGKLINDETTVENLNDTIATANELLEKVNRFQTTVSYRGDYYAVGDANVAGGMKNTLAVKLASRKDYYYTFELVSDPVPDSVLKGYGWESDPSSATTYRVFSDAYQMSFQFARRWRDLVLKLGIRENHGGVGAEYYWLEDKLALALDVYDFSTRPLPNVELRARYGFYNHLYLSAGVDDVANRLRDGGVNLYFGGGFSFRDDDLKYLLSFVPLN